MAGVDPFETLDPVHLGGIERPEMLAKPVVWSLRIRPNAILFWAQSVR